MELMKISDHISYIETIIEDTRFLVDDLASDVFGWDYSHHEKDKGNDLLTNYERSAAFLRMTCANLKRTLEEIEVVKETVTDMIHQEKEGKKTA